MSVDHGLSAEPLSGYSIVLITCCCKLSILNASLGASVQSLNFLKNEHKTEY